MEIIWIPWNEATVDEHELRSNGLASLHVKVHLGSHGAIAEKRDPWQSYREFISDGQQV